MVGELVSAGPRYTSLTQMGGKVLRRKRADRPCCGVGGQPALNSGGGLSGGPEESLRAAPIEALTDGLCDFSPELPGKGAEPSPHALLTGL